MKFIVTRETNSRVRIMSPEGLNSKYSTFEYQPILDIHADNSDAIALIVTPTGKGVDRISFMRVPVFNEVGSDEELANIVLTHLSQRGFDLEKVDALVYDAHIGTDTISATAVQYGYYDEYAGIVIEKEKP